MAYWAVAQTQCFAESRAQRFLSISGFESYLPKVVQVRKINRKRRKFVVPLFRTYLFVRIMDTWHAAQNTFGVRRLLLDENKTPIHVQDAIISELRAREDRYGIIQLPEKPKFKLGQKVKITTGQFVGCVGLYNGMSKKERERVLINLLGRMTQVELTIGNHIEAVL